MHYTISLDGGKYTVINETGALRALRYGEPWRDLVGDGLVLAMAQRIEDLECAVKDVLDGTLDERGVRGCQDLGMVHYSAVSGITPLRRWELALRSVLEQKS